MCQQHYLSLIDINYFVSHGHPLANEGDSIKRVPLSLWRDTFAKYRRAGIRHNVLRSDLISKLYKDGIYFNDQQNSETDSLSLKG